MNTPLLCVTLDSHFTIDFWINTNGRFSQKDGCIAGGVWLGVWLDGKYELSPLFTLLGLGIGLFMAFYGTYRMLREMLGGDKNDNK